MSSEERVTLNAEGENSKAIYIKENKDGVKIYNEIKKDPIPRFLNPIKVSPKEIIGRETALQELLGLIKQEETVYIHAIRGVGKTTLGKLVYHHLKELDSFSYYAIVELTESFLESFIEKLRVPCRVDVVEGETDEDRLQKILHALTDVVEKDSSEKNGFILIDNALPRKAKGSRDFLKEVIDHLSSNWKILVTSFEEIPYLKEYKLDYLTDEKALELFLFHCPDKGSKEDIQVLLNHVGKHTLTVELMAKTLKTASRIKSVAELFDILKKHELGKNPSARKKIHANHPKGEVIAFEYISKIFDMTELENEKNLIY
ncbi:MAG: hypothetical protein KDK45_06280, partial [Leptospiraceae bacterium]|nr:hypothetical protein [Leptospiraceae bacterium]